MTSSSKQLFWMGMITTILVLLYCSPFPRMPIPVTAGLVFLFPPQLFLWRLTYGRRAKDFAFCFSLILLALFLKHYWPYADLIFYLLAIVIPAVIHYRTFLALTLSAFVLETLREYYYQYEQPDEILFRYVLFFVAGTLIHVLLRDEQRLKEGYRKELEDLKYGIRELEAPIEMISDTGRISRKVDAAIALNESLQTILRLVHNIFKSETTILWQFLPEKKELRIWNTAGEKENLKVSTVFPLGEGPIGWTALNKKTFWKQGQDIRIEIPVYKKNPGIQSFIAVPILDNDRLEGVLSLDSVHPCYFAADAETALLSFAGQFAETIRMARLAKEREERAFEFQAFYQASKDLASLIDFQEIVRKLHLLCGEIVKSEFLAIATLQGNPENYTLYEWNGPETDPLIHMDLPHNGSTWISWFLQSREEPLILSESQLQLQQMPLLRKEEELRTLKTFLAVPMRHQQACIGALLLGSQQKDAFTSHQARVLSILCNQAAVSLENSAIIKKMEQLAITDGLTGLFNHRYFQESLEKEMARAERQKQPLSLLLMDIDHFKGLNDSFGHPAGDFVLKNLAALLKSNARKIDILARYGGEEFAALLPGVDLKNARKTAERWRKAVQRASFKWQNKSFAITVSIGVAVYPEDAAGKAELIDRADKALYDAKENGRNQVRHCLDKEAPSPLFG